MWNVLHWKNASVATGIGSNLMKDKQRTIATKMNEHLDIPSENTRKMQLCAWHHGAQFE